MGERKRVAVPARLLQAIELIDVRPGQRILEIGGGRGVLAALVRERLGDGQFVGIDRSGPATAAAIARNQDAVARGIATFEQIALEDVDAGELGTFDTVLAVNVNLFWTRPATRDLGLVADLLAPGGTLWLVYEVPPGSDTSRIERLLGDHLEKAGFRPEIVRAGRVIASRASTMGT